MRVNTFAVLAAIGLLRDAPRAAAAPHNASAITQNEIDSIMQWANHFSEMYGLPRKTWDRTLHRNADMTGQEGGGVHEQHHLFPGSRAQVITPGMNVGDAAGHRYAPYGNFQAAYLAWLCERPHQPQLHGTCPHLLRTTCIDDAGQTGHSDILTSDAYRRIGCAFTTNPHAAADACWHGIWVCDLA